MEIVDKIRGWFKPRAGIKSVVRANERICISINAKTCLFLQLSLREAGFSVKLAENLPFESIEKLHEPLSFLVKKYDLTDCETYWLLRPDEYQIFLIESLPVKQEEIREALNWRLRSLISQPIEETTIDYFIIPAKKSASNNPLIAAVTTWSKTLEQTTNMIKNTGLNLANIDIPELAMTYLAAKAESETKTIAFIYFYNDLAILNISREKTLYFTRRINITIAKENFNYESFCLDIMRYFDYFQSQWRQPTPAIILIASESSDVNVIIQGLKGFLQQPIEAYSATFVLNSPLKNEPIEKRFLLPLGCLLRE